MNTSHRSPGLSLFVCVAMLVTTLCACSVMMTKNHPVVGKGPTFYQSFEAVQMAMKSKGYSIAKTDKASGQIQTGKRTNRDYWWIIDAHVSQDGTVEFFASGSERVAKGDKIHRRVLNYAEQLKRTFEQNVSSAHSVAK